MHSNRSALQRALNVRVTIRIFRELIREKFIELSENPESIETSLQFHYAISMDGSDNRRVSSRPAVDGVSRILRPRYETTQDYFDLQACIC